MTKRKEVYQVLLTLVFLKIAISAIGQPLLTYKKVNDFEPGQVTIVEQRSTFEDDTFNQMEEFLEVKDSIMNKTVDMFQQQVTYQIFRRQRKSNSNYISGLPDIWIPLPDSIISKNFNYSNEPLKNTLQIPLINTPGYVTFVDTTIWQSQIEEIKMLRFQGGYLPSTFFDDSTCFYVQNFGGPFLGYRYRQFWQSERTFRFTFKAPGQLPVFLTFNLLTEKKNLLEPVVLLFPNPVKNILHLSPSTFETDYSVFNQIGIVCFSGRVSREGIDLKDLKKGVYQIKLLTRKGKSRFFRFVKE